MFLTACAVLLVSCILVGVAWRRAAGRQAQAKARIRALEERLEALADANWELREAGERARSLLDAQGDLIVRRNGHGIVTFANDAFCALVGAQRDVIVNARFNVAVIEQRDATVLADGTRLYDQKIATPQGPRWISWREVPVRDARDARTELQSVGRDVTERTEAARALAEARDQAESASRAKSRFLAVVSHEIRTPLNGILGMADLLRDTALTPEQATYVNAVTTSGHTLLSLIEDVLDFSKIEAGRIALNPTPFALTALVEETVELLAPRAQAKGLEVGSYVDDGLPLAVTGDADRLRQMLLNLAGNAVKFTESGGLAVIVERGTKPDEVVFSVTDTGIGIDPGAQQRIFREFEQADASATRRFGGTGLGLAITRGLVESMSGDITLQSEPGRGSCFRVALPLPAAAGAPPPKPSHDLHGGRILIVGPAVTAPLMARQLRHFGAAVTIAAQTAESLQRIAAGGWDAALIDGAIGLAAVTRVLQGGVENAARRIALITPAERAHLPALRDAGMTGYLIKPVRSASLLAVLAGMDADAEERTAPLKPAAAPPTAPDAPAISLRVLVAEDNEINALLTRSLLEKLGHQPTVAGDGAAALDLWQSAREGETPYDVVLMDINMPIMDGVEAARRIRAAEDAEGEARSIVIALSASAMGDDRAACLAAGMDGFLVKPLERDQLMHALEEIVGARHAAA